MQKRRGLSYANVMATIAVFLALGGGAWAASGTLVSSNGEVAGCVAHAGGPLRIVHQGARCRRGEVGLSLASAPAQGKRGPRGPRGPTGRTGPTGSAGTTGATGASGAALHAYSFSFSPTYDGTPSTKFGSNELRLHCVAGTCSAQVAVGVLGTLTGTNQTGPLGGEPASTQMLFDETPATVALVTIAGSNKEGTAHATLMFADGAGFYIDVQLVSEMLGNVRLVGTAIPTEPAGP